MITRHATYAAFWGFCACCVFSLAGCHALHRAKGDGVDRRDLSDREVVERLQEVEQDILRMLGSIQELENSRAQFARLYESDDDRAEWNRLLRSVPSYDETKAFPYAEYLSERTQIRAQMRRRVLLLSRQVDFLEEYFTSGDEFIIPGQGRSGRGQASP